MLKLTLASLWRAGGNFADTFGHVSWSRRIRLRSLQCATSVQPALRGAQVCKAAAAWKRKTAVRPCLGSNSNLMAVLLCPRTQVLCVLRRQCRRATAQAMPGRQKRMLGREGAAGRLWCACSPADRLAAAAGADFAGCFDSIPSALAALAAGEVVVVLDDEARENEGDLIMAADKARTRCC